MKGINLGASPEPFLPPQAAGYWTRKGIKSTGQNRGKFYSTPELGTRKSGLL